MDARLAAELEVARLPPAEYVDRLYRLVLRREPDPDARAWAVEELDTGTLSRAALLRQLVETDEYARLRALDDAVALARWARAAGERPRGLRGPAATDERLIEIPWTLARYRGEPRVLDLGYAFAEPAYLAALLEAAPGAIVGADLAERAVPGIDSVVADVRSLPFPDGSFDIVFCISTLEHVGRDVGRYGVSAEPAAGGMKEALAELRRVLARGGRVLLTVPCGRPEEHDWFVQLDERAWLELFREAGFIVFEHEAYELGEKGWTSSGQEQQAAIRYGSRGPGASSVLCVELHPARTSERLRAAARGLRRV